MKSDIRVCSAWRNRHDRPVYTLGSTPTESTDALLSAANANNWYGYHRDRDDCGADAL
ncbi:MAG: H/ACA RNA-protein complex component Nop10p [Haloplanus sp.]